MLARFLATSIVLQSAGLGLMFLAQLALARALGAREFGVYAYANAWLMTLVLLARFGCDITILRFGGASIARRDLVEFGRMLRVCGLTVLKSSGATSTILIVVSMIEVRMHPAGDYGLALLVAAAIIPVLALSGLRQAALLAAGHVAQALTPEYVVRPVLIGVGALAMIASLATVSAPMAMASNLSATLGAFALGHYWLRRIVPAGAHVDVSTEQRLMWIRSSASTLVFTGTQQLLTQVDMIIGGALVLPDALGPYAASRQLASVGLLGLFAFQNSTSSRIAAAHAQGDFRAIARLVRAVAWGGLAFAAFYAVALVLLGPWALALFGRGFPDAQSALWLLLAGQVLAAAGGPSGVVAAMIGLQRGAAIISTIAVCGCAVMTGLLSAKFGVLGVAGAVCLSTTSWCIGMNWLIYRKAGFTVWIGSAFLRQQGPRPSP